VTEPGSPTNRVVEMLRESVGLVEQHAECVRHYIHLQLGVPKSSDLKSAPEIALDNAKSEVVAKLKDLIKEAESA
jgi:hypothetical protein